MYTVDDITDLLKKAEFNIATKDGLQRVKGYTACIDCVDGTRVLKDVPIGLHKTSYGCWVVSDLETGKALTSPLVWKTRKDAIGAFIAKYPAYSRYCIHRAIEAGA